MKKKISIICILLLLCVILTAFSSCVFDFSGVIGQFDDAADTKPEELHGLILSGLNTYQQEMVFYNIDEETVAKEYEKVLDEHPEIFWAGAGYKYETVFFGKDKKITFKPFLSNDSPELIESKREKLTQITEAVVNNCAGLQNDYEKALYVHDYIVDNTEYDSETAEKISAGKNDVIYPSTTAYGCLADGKAVCSGYAAAYQMLLEKCGIECRRIVGTVTQGEPHAWNCIKLDGEWYFVDVTWDDPMSDDGNKKTYEYFCATAEELLITHKINEGQDVPACSSVKYDIFRNNGMFFDKYSFEQIEQAVSRQNDSDEYSFKFSSAEETDRAVADLITGQRIFEIKRNSERRSVRYSKSTSGLVLTLTFL